MDKLTISREAVELAARTLVDSGAVSGKGWDELQPAAKFAWFQRARKALHAAAPLIAADVLDQHGQQMVTELEEEFEDSEVIEGPGAEEVMAQAKKLHARAAELRAQS